MSKQQILPSNTLNSLELTLPGQNTAGKALHPLQQAPKTLAEMEDAAMFNRALQVGVSCQQGGFDNIRARNKHDNIWSLGTRFCHGLENGAASVGPPQGPRPISSNSRRRCPLRWVVFFSRFTIDRVQVASMTCKWKITLAKSKAASAFSLTRTPCNFELFPKTAIILNLDRTHPGKVICSFFARSFFWRQRKRILSLFYFKFRLFALNFYLFLDDSVFDYSRCSWVQIFTVHWLSRRTCNNRKQFR